MNIDKQFSYRGSTLRKGSTGRKIPVYKKMGDVYVKVGELDEEEVKKDPLFYEPDADVSSEIFIDEEEEEVEEGEEERTVYEYRAEE